MASFKAAALTSLLASAGLVSAQGFFYQKFDDCSAEQDHRYLGCAPVTKQPFGYNPGNPDGDYSQSFPGYAVNGHVNSTVTPAGCTKTCRGHGFKYAAMYERGCRCGTSIAGLSPSTTNEGPCQNNDPCRGDGRENCGSTGGARIYVDPSFQDYASVTDKVANYGVLGCFYDPNLPTGDTDISEKKVSTAADCLTFCATNYYPFAYMAQNGQSTNGINCKCGQDFGLRARSFDDTSSQFCKQKCSAAEGVKGCTGQDCCGNDREQVYPVYANPDYMGCNLPRIPGIAPKAIATPADNQYTCISTPQSILARATHTIEYANRPKVTRSATFVATATAGARTYINFGCYPDADRTDPVTGGAPILAAALPNQKVSVSNCIAACSGQTPPKDWVALRGAVGGALTGAACICGTAKGNLGNSNDMEICKLPCDGADNTENCGPDNGVLVYAISSSATTGDWYTSYTSTFSVTHTYSCTPTDSSSSASATTSSEVVSTTSSEAVSTTSSEAVSTTSSEAVSTTSSANNDASTTSSANNDVSTTSSANNDASTTSSANADVSTTSSANQDGTTTSSANDGTSTGNADASTTSTAGNPDVSTTSDAGNPDTSSTSTAENPDVSTTSAAGDPDATSTSTAADDETSTTGSGSESTGGPASDDASSTEAGNTGASTGADASNTSKPTTPATDNASATSSEGMQTTPDSTIAQTLSPPTNGPGGDSTTRRPSSTGQQGGDSTSLPGGASTGEGPSTGGQGPATSAGDGPSTGGQGPATSGSPSTGGQGPATSGNPSTGGQGPATSGNPSTGGQDPATSGGASTGGQGPATSGGASTGGQGPATSAGDSPSTGGQGPATSGSPSTGGQGPATSGGASTGGQGPATSGGPDTGGQGPATSGGASTGGQGPATSGGASTGGQGPATSGGDFSSPGSEPTSPGVESSATPATRTSTSSGSASSTSAAAKPTVTLASLEVKSFSALFSGEVPVLNGAFVPLIIYDEDGNPSQQSYVVELLGCYLVPSGKVPFSEPVKDFKGNEKASGSASSCAGFCAGTGLKLSANNGGVCYCGDEVETQNLELQDLKSCSTPCPDGSGEICGGGDKFQKRWLSRRANTFVTIILAIPANDVVLYNKDGGAVSDVPFLSMSYPPVSISASGGVGTNSATGSGSASTTGSATDGGNVPTGSATDGGNVPTGSATDGGNVPTGSATDGGNVPTGSATDGGNVPTGSATDGGNVPTGSATDGGNVPTGSATDGGNVPTGSMTGPNGSDVPGGSATTGPGASATNSAGIPGVTDLPQAPILLSVIPGLVNVTNKKRDFAEMYRRQSLGGFIGAAGPVNPVSCSDATPFNLTQGRLESGGQFIATEPNVPFIEMKVVPAGAISTTFTVVNGVLFWYNAAFVGGQAGFCQVASGQVYATFGGPGTGPANCNTISIVAYQASQCQNGALSTATPPIGGPGGPSGPAPTGTATGTGGAGNNGGSPSSDGTPSSSGIYRLTESPAGELCVTTTLAFVPGAPTFVPLA